MIESLDYYQILGVAPDAPPERIKAAYRKRQRDHHPDRNGADTQAHERSALINLAYQELRDSATRANYDRALSVRLDASARARGRAAHIRPRFVLRNLPLLRVRNAPRWTICISIAAASCVLLAWALGSGATTTSGSSPALLERGSDQHAVGAAPSMSFGPPRSEGIKGRLSYHLDPGRLP